MKKILIIILFIAIGCAHQNKKQTIQIDSSKVLPWSIAHKDISTAKSPALYQFSYKNKNLFYLAAKHVREAPNSTFEFIDLVIGKKSVNVVVIEGFQKDLGISPQFIVDQMKDSIKGNSYSNGEPSYAVIKAAEKSIPFIGGEPNDKYIYKQVLAQGYKAEDLLGFNFVRRIPQEIRSLKQKNNNLRIDDLELNFNNYIKTKIKDFGMGEIQFTFADFKKWYKEKQGRNLSLESGQKGEAAPIDDGPFFTQKISMVVTLIRDQHILETIAEMMNQYENVFIIYGSSHYRLEHLALKKAFGEPKEIQL